MEGQRRHIRERLSAAESAFRRLITRGRREKHYRSPQEIALANAADSLGTTLGDDYLNDDELGEILPDGSGSEASDRIDASREELLAYIYARRRRRRRRVLRAAGMLLAMASVVALINELVRTQITDKRGTPRPTVLDGRLALSPPMRRGVSLSRGGNRVTTVMPAPGGVRLVHSAYVDIRGEVCLSTSNVLRGVTQGEAIGCSMSPRDIARALDRVPAIGMGSAGGHGYTLFSGVGGSELERIVSIDPRLRVDTAISSTWHPGRAPGDEDISFRTFLVRIWKRAGVRYGASASLAVDRRNLGLVAVLANGDEVAVTNYLEAVEGEKPPAQIIDRIL